MAYVRSDTLLLQEGCLKFREQFKKISGGIDPFQVSCTIASACNYLFRAKFLKPNTIGLVPSGGYRHQGCCSVVGCKYLDWLEREREIVIEREVTIRVEGRKWTVDGYHRESNTVFEFNGKIWHGCKCIGNRDLTLPGSMKTVEEAWQQTELKKKMIRDAGYEFEEYWECCDLQPALAADPEM